MVRLHLLEPPLYPVVRHLDGQPVAAAGRTGHRRPLLHAFPLAAHRPAQPRMVPPQSDLQIHLRVGQRNRFRNGRRLAHPHLRLPDVRHPVVVDGVVASHRRLPLREQGGLRPPDAQHAGVVPLRTPYDALLTDEEILLGVHPMAVPPAQRIAQHRAQRRGGLQLPRRRHGAAPAAGRHLLRRAARIPAHAGRQGGPRETVPRLHGHHPSGRQARELHQTLRGHRRRLAQNRGRRSLRQRRRRLPSRASSTCIR